MNSEKYSNQKINLTTITPVFIGDDQGSDLSPLTDFIVDGNRARIIDQNKFESLLSSNPESIDEFISQIKNNSRNFNLEEFIEGKLNSNSAEVTKYTLEVEGFLGNNSVNSFISSLSKPFIPGSTIKGAVRTAIIHNYLLNSDAGKSTVTQILKKADSFYQRLEKLERKKDQRLDKQEFDEHKKLKNKWKLEKEFKSLYSEVDLFKGSNGHDMRHLQFSDSPLLDNLDTKVTNISVEYLIKDHSKTSPWKQVLKEEFSTSFQFKIEKNISDEYLRPINSFAHTGIFKILNKFSKDVIEFELERFDEFISSGKSDKKQIEQKLTGIKSLYSDLLDKINKSEDKFAIMRIGGGKTYFDNSIGLALYKGDKDKFKQFRKLFDFWKHRNKTFVEEDSPITRSFVFDTSSNKNIPLGWVVIYPEENKNLIQKLFFMTKITQEKKSTIKKQKDDSDNLDLSKLSNLGKVTYGNNK